MDQQENADDVEVVPETDGADEADPAAALKRLRERLKQCEAEKQEYLDGWQRAKADLANYKKDEARRAGELVKFAAEAIAADLIPALDSLDLALAHPMPPEVERGVILIRSQLEDALKRSGLEAIHVRGERFDPTRHEAVGEVESDGEEGLVVEELQRGWSIAGKVIRPARVKVSKARSAS